MTVIHCQDFDELLDGTLHKERSDSLPYHHPVGFAAECDGLEDFLFARTRDA
jgi:hypothetical protein